MPTSPCTSTEKYNPITGIAIPVHPTRSNNTSAIFGGSPGNIEYMFIPPSATTRPTIPTTTSEKRRSLSKESLRRSIPTVTEGQPDSDECSSISDVSECSSEAEHRERTRKNSGSLSKPRKPITRSVSSRLPVSASKPCVMKRAHSFTRGSDSCVPRAQVSVPRGSTNNQQQVSSMSDLSSQPRRPSTEGTSKIPRKPNAGPGPQSSRIPLKRADVNSNVAERETVRSGKESTVNKRTAPADSKVCGTAGSSSTKQISSELKEAFKSEPVTQKQSAVSGIPVKEIKLQQHTGISRVPPPKPDRVSPRVRNNIERKPAEQNQNIDKENDDNKSAMQVGKSMLKHEGTGGESRVVKSDVTKSKLPRKSNIPKSNVAKTLQQKTRNNSKTELVEMKTAKTNDSRLKASSQQSARGESTRPAETTSTNASNNLQRSDSGFGDTDSVSSKDALIPEHGNQFSLSRENSNSKIPIISKSRGTTKSSRDAPSNDERRPKDDMKKVKQEANGEEFLAAVTTKLENETEIKNEEDNKASVDIVEKDKVKMESDHVRLYQNEMSHEQSPEPRCIPDTKVENITNKTTETSSKENLLRGLGTTKGVEVTSQKESHDFPNKDIEQESETCNKTRDKSDLFNTHGGLETTIMVKTGLQKSGVQIKDGGSLMSNNGFITEPADNVTFVGKENVLSGFEGKQRGGQKKEIESSNEKQSVENQKCLVRETASTTAAQKDMTKKTEIEKQSSKCFENEQKPVMRKTTTKQSPRKPPRLSKISIHDDTENRQKASALDTRQENTESRVSDEESLNKELSLVSDIIKKPSGAREEEIMREPDVGEIEDTEEPKGVGQSKGVGQPEEVEQAEDVRVNGEDPPRRSDNCMQCRIEQSMTDGEDLSMVDNDPGFRQYPTFISPRKSLVTCKHHAKQNNDMEMPREQADERTIAMTSLAAVNNERLTTVERFQHEPDLTTKTFDTRLSSKEHRRDINEVAKIRGVVSPIGEKSDKISPKSVNTEILPDMIINTKKDGSSRNTASDSRQVETKNQTGPKGSHSPLLALSRDKKFASTNKPTEDIKTALSLEWDDTGTELSPPNFSDDDDEIFSGPGSKQPKKDIEETGVPSVKLMNTNEALDKLKVIQSLIIKEADSRNRQESEGNAGKYEVGVKKTEAESVESAGNEENFGGKHGSESTSNPLSPTFKLLGRKVSSPTIWDRITDRSMSQDQTTELLNETLAKLKASPKLSGNAFARKSLSSRSLPGSRQASKEQLLSDGERPVYVYTSNWMNTSGKNSRGSSLSLCSANRSLPSSRQNLTKEPRSGLKRSESAAGRMEKENGKRIEPKEFRLSDFDEINLSDDGVSELKSQKAINPALIADKPGQKDGEMVLKKSKRRKKSKNTAAKMNNVPAYDVSMDDLTEGKTKCQCGGKNCVIM